MMAGNSTPKNRELPSKEGALFKQILKFYEHKQYKKGLKMADQILKRFANHGETQAMKGLFLSHLDRKEEGYEFVKLGVRNDLASHICWHVYGLMRRADKNYEEAIKCYTQALKYDKENMQIIRDLSLLQIQMRSYESFNETRNLMLSLKPNLKFNWVGLAVSYHLLGSYEQAIKVLSVYEQTLKDSSELPFELGELLMYRNSVWEESGDCEQALRDLDMIEKQVVDKMAWKEAKVRLRLKLGRKDIAASMAASLVETNPDRLEYIKSYAITQNVNIISPKNPLEKEKALQFLADLAKKYPRSHILKRTPLQITEGDAFKDRVDEYLKPMLRKGVPSLFVALKSIFTPAKLAIIESLSESYLDNLRNSSSFSTDGQKEPPSTLTWTLLFAAQLYDYKLQSTKAIALIDELLEHTPTLVEAYMIKARIYKHAGDSVAAMKSMNEARELDLQDRFVNNKCTKYMLRNDCISDSEKTITLFTKSDSADGLTDLVDMQCMWFALEGGKSHMRLGQYGLALKKFHQIEKHFIDIYDDQFDFHSYCLRKMTLRAYMELLRHEDKLRGHKYYYDAAIHAAKIYLALSAKAAMDKNEEGEAAELSAADRKKAARKARKAELKAAEEKKDKEEGKKVKDSDPTGVKYLNAEDKIEEGLKMLRPLLELSPKRAEAWIVGAELHIMKGKFLQATRCILKAHENDASNEELLRLKKVIDSKLDLLFGEGRDMLKYIQSFIKQNTCDVAKILAAVKALRIVDNKAGFEFALTGLISGMKSGSVSGSVTEMTDLHKELCSMGLSDFAGEVQTFGAKNFPLSLHFCK